jgi:hypothetical protein
MTPLLGELSSVRGLLGGLPGGSAALPLTNLDETLRPLLAQLTGIRSLLSGSLGSSIPLNGLLPQVGCGLGCGSSWSWGGMLPCAADVHPPTE